jgi:predicted phage terminase large subunit-like protein
VRFWDCAGTEAGPRNRDPDWTVGALIGVHPHQSPSVVVADIVRGRWSPGEVDKTIRATAEQDGPHIAVREEREPGSAGKSVIQARARSLMGFDYAGRPATGDKITRWKAYASQAEVGNVALVRGTWNRAYLAELEQVPDGHDDQADASAGGFNELAKPTAGAIQRVRLTGW